MWYEYFPRRAFRLCPIMLVLASHPVSGGDGNSVRERKTLLGHTHQVVSVTFSPDGKTLASGSADETIRLWEVATGGQRAVLKGDDCNTRAIAFSPDGKLLIAVGPHRKTILLWDVGTGQQRAGVTAGNGAARASTMAISPTRRIIATTYGSNYGCVVRLWTFPKLKAKRTLCARPFQAYNTLAFSPDGKILAAGGWCRSAIKSDIEVVPVRGYAPIKLWDVPSGRLLRTFGDEQATIQSLAFSPDGSTIAAGSRSGSVTLWDAATGRLKATLRVHTSRICSVAFSPDGRLLASGSNDDTAIIWDVATLRARAVLRGHTSFVNSVAFSPAGRTLATASADDTIKLWDLTPLLASPKP